MANPRFVLRSLDVFTLYVLPNLPSFAVAGTAAILAAINKEQGTSLLARQFTYGAQGVSVGDALYNSYLTLDSVVGQGYKGSYTFRYNRVDLALAFSGKELTLTGTYANVHAAIAAINTKFGIALETRDVVNAAIPVSGGQITLTAAPTSIYYTPGTVIKLNGPIPFATVAPITDALGFDPET